MGWVAPRCIRGGISRRIRTHGPSVRRCTTSDVPAAFTGPGPEVLAPRWAQSHWISFALSVPPASAPCTGFLFSRVPSRPVQGELLKLYCRALKRRERRKNNMTLLPSRRKRSWSGRTGLSWYLGTRAPGVRQRNLRPFPELETLSRVMEGLKYDLETLSFECSDNKPFTTYHFHPDKDWIIPLEDYESMWHTCKLCVLSYN